MRKYFDIIIINVLALAIGIFLYFLIDKKIEILAATIATGISLALGIRNYNTENDKLFKELFIDFNSKYARKFNNRLLTIIDKYREGEEEKLSPKDEKLIVEYLNFCSEEYLWYLKNRIPKTVWDSWENGMIFILNQPMIHPIVCREKKQRNSYYNFFEKIEHRLERCKKGD